MKKQYFSFILLFALCVVCFGLAGCKPCECPDTTNCLEPESTSFTLPKGLTYANWTFNQKLYELQHKISIFNDPGNTVGIYFQLYESNIDGNHFYYGIQTITGSNHGLIFSRWGTRDLANVRTAPGGWSESAGYEGDFVGIRLNYDWANGDYTVRFTRAEADGAADWFDLYIANSSGTEQYVGGIRFQRSNSSTPATIDSYGGSWLEVYHGPTQSDDIPFWEIKLSPTANDGQLQPTTASSDYSELPNSDIFKDTNKNVYMIVGSKTPRCHPKGKLF